MHSCNATSCLRGPFTLKFAFSISHRRWQQAATRGVCSCLRYQPSSTESARSHRYIYINSKIAVKVAFGCFIFRVTFCCLRRWFLSAIGSTVYCNDLKCVRVRRTTLLLSFDRFLPNFARTPVQVASRDTFFHIPEKFPSLRGWISRKPSLWYKKLLCDEATGHGRGSATVRLCINGSISHRWLAEGCTVFQLYQSEVILSHSIAANQNNILARAMHTTHGLSRYREKLFHRLIRFATMCKITLLLPTLFTSISARSRSDHGAVIK